LCAAVCGEMFTATHCTASLCKGELILWWMHTLLCALSQHYHTVFP
jgi:hypothetical protein